MHPEKQAFLEALEKNKYDHDTRKIFADWLEDHDEPEEADKHRKWTPEFQKAEDWLIDFANQVELTYKEVISAGFNGLDTGVNMEPENYFYANEEKIVEYWRCWQLVTESTKPDDLDTVPFACSC